MQQHTASRQRVCLCCTVPQPVTLDIAPSTHAQTTHLPPRQPCTWTAGHCVHSWQMWRHRRHHDVDRDCHHRHHHPRRPMTPPRPCADGCHHRPLPAAADHPDGVAAVAAAAPGHQPPSAVQEHYRHHHHSAAAVAAAAGPVGSVCLQPQSPHHQQHRQQQQHYGPVLTH